jgi:hypothetical protein
VSKEHVSTSDTVQDIETLELEEEIGNALENDKVNGDDETIGNAFESDKVNGDDETIGNALENDKVDGDDETIQELQSETDSDTELIEINNSTFDEET